MVQPLFARPIETTSTFLPVPIVTQAVTRDRGESLPVRNPREAHDCVEASRLYRRTSGEEKPGIPHQPNLVTLRKGEMGSGPRDREQGSTPSPPRGPAGAERDLDLI